jgi:hypothetical protein
MTNNLSFVSMRVTCLRLDLCSMSGHGYAWLSLAAKPQQLQSQIRGWPAEDRQAVDGWLFVQNDIDNDLPQAR